MRVSKKTQIDLFKSILLEKNQSMNLFSRKSPKPQLDFLFDQGFFFAKELFPVLTQSPVLDIGAGNGFPGILMSILYPENYFYLCERHRKKAEFLKFLSSRIQLSNVKVLCKNAEEIRRKFQIIVSQAALSEKKMLKTLDKVLAPKGKAFFWKPVSFEKKWLKNSLFQPKVYKNYKKGEKNLVILLVERKKDSKTKKCSTWNIN